MLLADLACEDEGFRSALPDYEAALDFLTHPTAVGRYSLRLRFKCLSPIKSSLWSSSCTIGWETVAPWPQTCMVLGKLII